MELHGDDKPVGRVLNRREVLKLFGGAGIFILDGKLFLSPLGAQTGTAESTALPACVVRPELTEGPYFVDGQLDRSDIRIDPSAGSVKEGTLLRLTYRVSEITGGMCAPLAGAQVDVWHCDALGVYSGVQDPGFDTTEQLWLRGYQVTDENGIAEFITIVPGWYSGRAVHIHFKIRTDRADDQGYEFTSQLFFDPAQIETIYAQEPYAARGLPNTPNERDGIYQASDGLLTLELLPMTANDLTELDAQSGCKATFDIGLDLSDTVIGADDGAGGRGGSPGGRPGRP